MRNAEVKILVVCIVFIMAGWGLYSMDYNHHDVGISADADGIDAEVTGFLPADYHYMFMSGADVPDELYYYLDADMPGDVSEYKQDHFFTVLDSLLEIRGHSGGLRQDASQLEDMMCSSSADGKGVVFCTGVLPSNLCSGGITVLEDWISAGGTVYWMGPCMGSRIAHPDGTVSDSESPFFPDGSIAEGRYRCAVNPSKWSGPLLLDQTECTNGLNINTPGLDIVSLGLVDDEGFSAMSECGFGNGRIYVAGYNYSMYDNTRIYAALADAITCGVDHDTVLLEDGSWHKGYGDQCLHVGTEVHPGDVFRMTSGSPYVSWGVVKTF